MNIRTQLAFLFFGGILFGCQSNQVDADEQRFMQYCTAYDITGSFALYSVEDDEYTSYNKHQLDQKFTPASTFKICNSLIGIETGIIRDQNLIIQWDSVERQNPNWNKDTDLKDAFKNSTVWYYQELALRVGKDTMKYWLDKLEYGNADTSGGIKNFWLSGGLRITPRNQIEFIKKLVENTLPLSQRTMDIVKDIMIIENTTDYILYGKTGWGFQDNQDIGWFVGFIETNDKTYIFANCIQSNNPNNQHFARARTEIVYDCLTALGLIKK